LIVRARHVGRFAFRDGRARPGRNVRLDVRRLAVITYRMPLKFGGRSSLDGRNNVANPFSVVFGMFAARPSREYRRLEFL
jgi:hypothetical protein